MEEKNVSFEENLRELEDIVNKLEGGDVSLDEMMQLFESGIAKTRECNERLKKAEQKITVLMKNAFGEMEEKPFPAE
ncbi:MAG: exodeoxyribonuclease VII small subunit [Clostridia bacterium]|nr:exodeoxyribonuclease VII small subunit [Oscillospiraceae bacterium]MBQ7960892.1 exodeoxyribonuclease VII small subunit [Clostridia bacterium]